MKKRSHKVKGTQSCLTLCDPVDYTAHGILQVRILEWVAYPLLQGIFPTQGSNPGLLHCRLILYQLSYQGSPEVTWMSPNPIRKNSNTLRDIRHRSPREVIVRRQQPTSHGEDTPCWALHRGPEVSGTAPSQSVVFCDSSPTWYVIIKNRLHNKMTIKSRFVINVEEIWLWWFPIFSHKELRMDGLWCSEQPNDKGMTRVMKECLGLPWWLSGKESACQCRRHRQVGSRIWEDPSCRRAAKPVHNGWAGVPEPRGSATEGPAPGARALQKRSRIVRSLSTAAREEALLIAAGESPRTKPKTRGNQT